MRYNGRSFKEFHAQRTAAYVEQEDVHMGELTVHETLDFAARCMGAGSKTSGTLPCAWALRRGYCSAFFITCLWHPDVLCTSRMHDIVVAAQMHHALAA